jgi:transposase
MERRDMHSLFSLWNSIQQYLIPHVEESLGPLSEKEAEFVRAAEFAPVDGFAREHMWVGNGRKPHLRKPLALAFLAKAVWNLPTTRALIDFLKANGTARALCGWERAADVPSESTFSRAFDRFAEGGLPGRLHEAMVRAAMEERLVWHASMDSTEAEARERAAAKPKKEKKPKPMERQKPGPKKGHKRGKRQPKRLDLQAGRTLEENLADLPRQCDYGFKRNSKGFHHMWKGYKLHMAVADCGAPICAVLTSASTHDSQVAIPLMQMGSGRAAVLYDLADSAYDAAQIGGFSRSMGRASR